jgi:hypothetical protein|nr:MAG TPA: hypothetical protein [Caudoviricetes sp.]
MNKEELIKEFDERQKALRDEFIAKLEDDKKKFKLTYPENDEIVYYIDSDDGEICDTPYFSNNKHDIKLFEHGLYFNTEQEAEQHLKERKLLFKLHQWAKEKNGGWELDWSNYDNKYVVYYNDKTGFLGINTYNWSNHISLLPTFKTRKIAQECIDIFGDEIKEVLC